jgi:hypothetical protein
LIAGFLRIINRDERKDKLNHIFPHIIDKALNGMTVEEKKLIESVVELMNSNITHTES